MAIMLKLINFAELITFLFLFNLIFHSRSISSFLTSKSFSISDDDVPYCEIEGEPCGFYDISLNGNIHFDWIKSWCKCPSSHACLYVEQDLRHKVYKFACIKNLEQQNISKNVLHNRSRNRLVIRRTKYGRRSAKS